MSRRASSCAWVVALALGLSGCQLGPGRLKVSSAHYSDAVRVATSEQLLVNLVRLRYRDLPVFLDVTSISTQFEFDAGFDAAGSARTLGVEDEVFLGAGIRYSERPTISFGIHGGEEFQKAMLRPIPVISVALVVESGWRSDRVLRLLVEDMNGLHNAPTASGPTPTVAPEYARFLEATTLLHRLAREGAINFEFENRWEAMSGALPAAQIEGLSLVEAAKAGAEMRKTKDGEGYELMVQKRRLVLRFSEAAEARPDVQELRRLLRLAPGQRKFDVVPLDESDVAPLDPDPVYDELALDTRSLMGALYYASQAVEVPEAHAAAGLATATAYPTGEPFAWSELLGEIFRVHWSEDEPEGAAVAVKHRGHWFYLADDDETSKSTFVLLHQLFALTAPDSEQVAPVLTIDVGS